MAALDDIKTKNICIKKTIQCERKGTTRNGTERNERNETTRRGKTGRETERKRTKETKRNETKWCKENIKESKYPYWIPLRKIQKTNSVKFSIFLILSIGFFFCLRIPTAGMELLVNGRYHCMKRVSDNFFIASGLGKMGTPLSVRLTAINGYQVTTRIPEIKNDFDFPSKVQFKGIKRGRE